MYSKGQNRIFYQSNHLEERDVKVEIVNPCLEKVDKTSMIFAGEGLYYIDLWFQNNGSYVFRVFEDDIKIRNEILHVSEGSSLVIYPQDDIWI